MSDFFKTIEQHWAHFLERDIDPRAPAEQVSEMKRAFAAGAISGIALAIISGRNPDTAKENIQSHVESITNLVRRK